VVPKRGNARFDGHRPGCDGDGWRLMPLRTGIIVNAIAPRGVASMRGTAHTTPYIPSGATGIRETPPARFALQDEIAQIALFLASGDARFVTGAARLANGGWHSS